MRKRKGTTIALAVLIAAVVTAAALVGRATPQASAAPSATACTKVNLGVLAPLTGPAAFLGAEQLSWVQYAVSLFNKQFQTQFGVKQADTQLSASLARTAGRKLVSDKSIYGVVGGSTSQSVISSAGLFKAASLASVSGSATRVDLTNGQFPTFFRVVPNDGVQAPSIANFLLSKLKVKKVVVIDSQDDYSTALAPAITARLKAKGVSVQRESVAADESDFSNIVTNVPDDANVVVFATQTATAANTLSQQLLEQGKKAVVFGTDGAYSPSQYKPRHGYVSSFANDLNFVPSAKSIVSGYKKFSKGKTFGTFGPPSYMAAWVLMAATNAACKDGAVTRGEVSRQVKRTNVPSILGGSIRFTPKGDVAGAKFYVFEVKNGKYANVG
jgi:branched-chain amino acid transport system substrate-binding protein